jgi:hypothetical protein
MPFLGLALSFLNPGKLLELAGKILDFLKSPIGIALMIGLAYFIGHWRGGNAAEEICQAEKRESAQQAARMDGDISSASFRGIQERARTLEEMNLALDRQNEEERFRASQLSQELQACRRLSDAEWERVKP